MRFKYLGFLVLGLLLGGGTLAQSTAIEHINEGFEEAQLPTGWERRCVNTPSETKNFAQYSKDTKFTKVAHSGTVCLVSTASRKKFGAAYTQLDDYLILPKLKFVTGAEFSFWVHAPAKPNSFTSPDQDNTPQFKVLASLAGNSSAEFTNELLEVKPVPHQNATDPKGRNYTKYSIKLSEKLPTLAAGAEFWIAFHVKHEIPLQADVNRVWRLDDVFYGVSTGPIGKVKGNPEKLVYTIGDDPTVSKELILENSGDGNLQVSAIEGLAAPFTCTLKPLHVNIPAAAEVKFSFGYEGTAPTSSEKQKVKIKTNGGDFEIELQGETKPQMEALESLYEEFSTTILPENWQIRNFDQDPKTWKINRGGGSIYSEQTKNCSNNNWLILPRIKVKAGMSLSFLQRSTKEDEGLFSIKVSKTGRKKTDFEEIVAAYTLPQGATADDAQKYSLDLSTITTLAEGDKIYLAICDETPEANQLLVAKNFVDNVRVDVVSSEPEIVSVVLKNKNGQPISLIGTPEIDKTAKTFKVTVPYGTEINALTPTFTCLPQGAAATPMGVQDFTNGAITYTIKHGTAEATWKVSVIVAKNSATDILTFNIPGQKSATVDKVNKKILIVVPIGTSITALVPTITLSAGATVSPASGVAQDFSYPVEYTVTAEDGQTKQKWTVSVSEKSSEADILTFTIPGQIGNSVIDKATHTITVYMPETTDVKHLTPTFTISTGASVTPASGIEKDFSNPVIYTVKAQDDTPAAWTARVMKIAGALESFSEEFDEKKIPDGWTVVDADKDGRTWEVKTEMHKGIAHSKVSQAQRNDWLISPRVKVSANELRIIYKSSAVSYKQSFKVWASKTTKNVPADFTLELTSVVDANEFWTEYKVKLEGTQGLTATDEVYIALQDVTNGGSELQIDRISVAPAPITPQLEFAATINEFRSVVEVNKQETSGDILAIKNIQAGTLTVSDVTLPEGWETTLKKDEVALANDGKELLFGVIFKPTKLGESKGEMVITTNGGQARYPLYGYAYEEGRYVVNFESKTSTDGWLDFDLDLDSHRWFRYENTPKAPNLAHSGRFCMVSESAYISGGLNQEGVENWLMSPRLEIKAGDKLEYWIGASQELAPKESYKVMISENIKDFQTVLKEEELSTSKWQHRKLDLAEYVGKKVYIAFVHNTKNAASQLLLDNILLPARYFASVPDFIALVMPFIYTKFPLGMSMTPECLVHNNGATATPGVPAKLTIEGTNYAYTEKLGAIEYDDVQHFYGSVFTPTKLGEYKTILNVDFAEDDVLENNKFERTFEVTDTVLARDNEKIDQFLSFGHEPTLVQQFYKLEKEMTITSISFQRAEAKNVQDFKGGIALYSFDSEHDRPTLLAEIKEITLTKKDVGWLTFGLKKAVLAPKGQLIAVLRSISGALGVALCEDQWIQGSLYIKLGSDNPKAIEEFPQLAGKLYAANIRINGKLGNVVNNEDNTNPGVVADAVFASVRIAPNPFASELHVFSSALPNVYYELLNTTGVVVRTGLLNDGETLIETSDVPSGLYLLRLHTQEGVTKSYKLIK
ncbi:MAG: choice-of-anchor J domain-containing protein [Bacteroides sp.]